MGPICDDVSTTRTPAALACVKTSPTTGRPERGMEVKSGLFIKLDYRQSTWDSRRSAQITILRVILSLEAPTPGSSNRIKAFTNHAVLKVIFLKLFSKSVWASIHSDREKNHSVKNVMDMRSFALFS